MTLIAAADGSALGNPGPAGWGWYIDENRWASGGWPRGTNNMGELTAVLDLLQQTAGVEEELLIYCDSVYAINSITKWMPGWKRKGWRKGDGKPVLNVDIMKALDAAMQGRRVRFEWVKGHSGHDLNTEADRLANAAAVAFKQGRTPDAGPGFGNSPSSAATGRSTESPGYADQPDLFGTPPDEASDLDRVVELERSLLTDEVRTDPAALAALLHEDWCEVGRSGRLWNRDEMLAELGPLAEPVELEPLSASRLDDASILLVWRSRSPHGTALRSSLWMREGGDWRQRYHQGTDES
ncbi:ribonuclease HI family protein [Micropruina sonneratiae]|uniref:ribonuclease HI family protein n=1 Tax=Micropruina sonneratiae TaxID=2986940 RepID=UPI00222703A9|nr:ribonuclease HI family protein [Micropruina sp. KQZ13P-5]MCW3157330.1 ribonuclease HI family protein [Micropruina sp. KQZ13P-5]